VVTQRVEGKEDNKLVRHLREGGDPSETNVEQSTVAGAQRREDAEIRKRMICFSF
jgi:hypothetical protein